MKILSFYRSFLLQTGNRVSQSGKAMEHKTGGLSAEKARTFLVSGLRFRIFAMLWAIATLFHMAHSGVFDSQLNYALLTLAALYVVFRPSLTGFILLILLQLFDAFYRMPVTTNHWIFTAFVNLTIIHAIIYLIVRNRSFNLNEGNVLETFAPVVRIEVIILYFFTFFHKLNAGFFSPASSCATDLLRAQHIDAIIPLSDPVIGVNAYFTVIIEFLIPFFLCFRRTRNLGIFTGLFFHCVLSYSSYNAFYDFSSMIFAVYFLFATDGLGNAMIETFHRLRAGIMTVMRPARYSGKNLMLCIFCFIMALAVVYGLTKTLDTYRTFHLYFFWTLYSLFFAYCFIVFMLRREENVHSPSFAFPHWSFAILPCVVFLNGASPYLGLKTENSFSMFSNLRTEGGVTNHYIVPAGFQVFPYQKDVVEIIASSDSCLQALAAQQKQLVLFEFSSYVHAEKPASVAYLLNGERRALYYSGSGPIDLPKNPYILSKLMRFRPFSKHEPQPCVH